MSKTYDHHAIEAKWQAYWDQARTFRVTEDPSRPKYYCLDMFPYPSGSGLHVGHLEGYTATDIVSRYKRMRGYNVLHPMGWDAFGLPAEQYAVKTGVHPAITTEQNIATFKRQMKRAGLSYDWDRELSTTDPDYYRWTQWIFLKLFERGLAYVAEVPVNWCPALGTVLANEEIVDGRSEVGGFEVIRKPMRQWVLKITAYADRLLEDLALVEWQASNLEMQKNWIGWTHPTCSARNCVRCCVRPCTAMCASCCHWSTKSTKSVARVCSSRRKSGGSRPRVSRSITATRSVS